MLTYRPSVSRTMRLDSGRSRRSVPMPTNVKGRSPLMSGFDQGRQLAQGPGAEAVHDGRPPATTYAEASVLIRRRCQGRRSTGKYRNAGSTRRVWLTFRDPMCTSGFGFEHATTRANP